MKAAAVLWAHSVLDIRLAPASWISIGTVVVPESYRSNLSAPTMLVGTRPPARHATILIKRTVQQ